MKPIVTLPQFMKPKVPLYRETSIVEVGLLIDLEKNNPKYREPLIKNSTETVCYSYNHFFRDNVDLVQIGNAILSGNYAVQDNGRKEISKRLDLISTETLIFREFEKKARPLSPDSPNLKILFNETNLLIEGLLKKNINTVSELI